VPRCVRAEVPLALSLHLLDLSLGALLPRLGASDCTAVGDADGPSPDQPLRLALHWNGTTWTPQHTPTPTASNRLGDSLDSVSCPTASVCMAVGQDSPAPAGSPEFFVPWAEVEGG
jgi:hypothetical protein